MPTPLPTRYERFAAKFIPEPNSGCWLWFGGVNEHGYGVFWNGERLEKAHRYSLRCSGVGVPAASDVLHQCDNPACVNPDHLYVGDAKQNVNDMWARQRATVQHRRGTAQIQAKLTDEKAAEIRVLWRTTSLKQRTIAAIYEVSQAVVWRVIHHKNWTNPSGVLIARGRGR